MIYVFFGSSRSSRLLPSSSGSVCTSYVSFTTWSLLHRLSVILNALKMLRDISGLRLLLLLHRGGLLFNLIECGANKCGHAIISEVALAVVEFVIVVIVRQGRGCWFRTHSFPLSPL